MKPKIDKRQKEIETIGKAYKNRRFDMSIPLKHPVKTRIYDLCTWLSDRFSFLGVIVEPVRDWVFNEDYYDEAD